MEGGPLVAGANRAGYHLRNVVYGRDWRATQVADIAAVRAAADALYDELRDAGVRVLYDDREETAGVKFNDADLIGLPIRLLVGERLLAEGMVEVKPRGGEARKVARGEIVGEMRTGAFAAQ
jgi:prolyl-tRNA synthetase